MFDVFKGRLFIRRDVYLKMRGHALRARGKWVGKHKSTGGSRFLGNRGASSRPLGNGIGGRRGEGGGGATRSITPLSS